MVDAANAQLNLSPTLWTESSRFKQEWRIFETGGLRAELGTVGEIGTNLTTLRRFMHSPLSVFAY